MHAKTISKLKGNLGFLKLQFKNAHRACSIGLTSRLFQVIGINYMWIKKWPVGKGQREFFTAVIWDKNNIKAS